MLSVEEKAARKARRNRIKRRNIMQDAHVVAKMIANLAGDYQVAMSFALKFVYAYRANRAAVKATGDKMAMYCFKSLVSAAREEFTPESVNGVPAWAIKKDFIGASADDILFYTISFEVLQETDKAYQVKFDTVNPDESGYVDHHTTWVAKSISKIVE